MFVSFVWQSSELASLGSFFCTCCWHMPDLLGERGYSMGGIALSVPYPFAR